MAGRPSKEYDAKYFCDLIALGCTQEEICWVFRDDKGKPANKDTLSRWCKREFGSDFQEFAKKNRAMGLKIKLRQYQINLAEKSAAMAIWLGKQYLGQRDDMTVAVQEKNNLLESLLTDTKDVLSDDIPELE